MASKDKNTIEEKSHSQVKREKRKKEVKSARRSARTLTIVGWLLVAVIVGLIAWGITSAVLKKADAVTALDDYSAGLDDNGYISGVTASEKVTLPDYIGVEVPYSEIEYTDEDIENDIQSLLDEHKTRSDDTSLTVADGDKVNIDYVGTIDGEEFDGGSSTGYDLTIGSGSFIDDFEDQLIGAQNGSTVTVNVTFPDDYSNADVAGKDAEFTVTINSIYVEPELTDEFIAENCSEHATTVEGYREYLRTYNETTNLNTWITTYLTDNTTVNSYPKKYLKTLKSIQKYDDMQSYQYMNELYQSYMGYSAYSSFEDYVGMTEEEYDESLKDTCKETCKLNLIYQAIVEKEGAVADEAYYKQYLADNNFADDYYESQVEEKGEPYTLQQAIMHKAIEIVADNAVIQK